jgi:hypothetical protein
VYGYIQALGKKCLETPSHVQTVTKAREPVWQCRGYNSRTPAILDSVEIVPGFDSRAYANDNYRNECLNEDVLVNKKIKERAAGGGNRLRLHCKYVSQNLYTMRKADYVWTVKLM